MPAGAELVLPVPGVMVPLSPPLAPPILRGLKVDPKNPLRFEFILDPGDNHASQPEGLKQEAGRLIKYFLASLTVPDQDLWVNLSPYEKNRIIPESFGRTEMGRDLLAEDYILKQITATLIYPEGETGKKFWRRVYAEAVKRYGTTNIPVNTFNKVWVVPDKAVVYEAPKAGTAYVVDSRLKVMLEEDYLSLEKHHAISNSTSSLGSRIVRQIVIPELSREVNEDKNFAVLRQVYNSLVLAAWYKKKIKDSILARVYEDRNKVAGVGYKDSSMNVEAIYQRYLQAFKKGVFNYIKEETDPLTQATIPRKYFSGGFEFVNLPARLQIEDTQAPPDTSKFIGVVADMAMAPPAADTLLAEDTLKARVAQLEDEIGYWKGSVINLSEDAGQDKKQLQRIWNFVDEGRIIKVNLNQFEESGRPKRETYELLSRRLFALAFSLAQAGKYNEPNVMISIFLLLEEAFTRGNHFNMELPIYVRLEAQGVKVFEVDLGALNQQPDEEDVEAARGVMARREMGDVLPSQFFHKAEKALMWNSQPVGRMISIGFQDFAMQAASPPQELLQKILTSDAEDPQAPLLIENINQRHWKLQSDASGKISISPAPRHNIRFASLLPNMVYRASFSLSQDKKVRVTFSKGNTQVAYQIDNYRYDPQAGTQQIFMGHKVVPENARDAMSAVLGPELKPSPEQISVFNQREWVVESSKSGMFSFSPAAYHVVLFAHLFPNTDYTVRLGLSAEGRVRVNFSNNQKKLTYQINDYAYDLGRRTQKIFIANKLKSMTMIGGLSPGQSQLMRQVVDGLERIDNSVTKEILQMRQMMTLPQAQQIARQRIYLEGLAGQGPFDSRVLLNNAITVRLNIFTVALKQGPQFNWEKNRPFILSLSQELFAAELLLREGLPDSAMVSVQNLWDDRRVIDLQERFQKEGLKAVEGAKEKRLFSMATDRAYKEYEIAVTPGGTHTLTVIQRHVTPETRAAVEKLAAERRPGVVPMFILPGDDRNYYELDLNSISPEYENLEYVLRHTKIRFNDVAEPIRQVVDASLRFSSNLWFVHGHLHPQNIMLRLDAGGRLEDVKLVDFKYLSTQVPSDHSIAHTYEWYDFRGQDLERVVWNNARVEYSDMRGLSLQNLVNKKVRLYETMIDDRVFVKKEESFSGGLDRAMISRKGEGQGDDHFRYTPQITSILDTIFKEMPGLPPVSHVHINEQWRNRTGGPGEDTVLVQFVWQGEAIPTFFRIVYNPSGQRMVSFTMTTTPKSFSRKMRSDFILKFFVLWRRLFGARKLVYDTYLRPEGLKNSVPFFKGMFKDWQKKGIDTRGSGIFKDERGVRLVIDMGKMKFPPDMAMATNFNSGLLGINGHEGQFYYDGRKLIRIGSGNTNIIYALNDADWIIRMPDLKSLSGSMSMTQSNIFTSLVSNIGNAGSKGVGPALLGHGFIGGRLQYPYIAVEKIRGKSLAELSSSYFSDPERYVRLSAFLEKLIRLNIQVTDFKLKNLMEGWMDGERGIWLSDAEFGYPLPATDRGEALHKKLAAFYIGRIQYYLSQLESERGGWNEGNARPFLKFFEGILQPDAAVLQDAAMAHAGERGQVLLETASEISPEEMSRRNGQAVEENFKANNYDVRAEFLELLHGIQQGRVKTSEEFMRAVEGMNRTMILGAHRNSPYIPPSLKPFYTEATIHKVAGVRRFPGDNARFAVMFENLKEFLAPAFLKQDALSAVWHIADFYYTAIHAPYVFTGGNNSLFMNMANALLRLRGFKGVRHGELDGYVQEISKQEFRNVFVQAVREANPQRGISDNPGLSDKGGIDFTSNKTPLEIQNAGEGIAFHLDPAKLQELQNAPGFEPVIIRIKPLGDLHQFLGAIVNRN